ncbi:MAG: hypothetical protein DRI97_17030 [Bacteroidetes bacterium]|nr:MAG: hypothetical protein DRI97_17030 [Bacteroidota bacterium]
MRLFKLRRQTAKTHRIGASTPCRWAEITTDDIKIVIDGCKTNNSLLIRVEANGVIYQLTDSLLELMLGKVAEEYSNEFLTFNVYEING